MTPPPPPTLPPDSYAVAYAELHEAVRRFLAGESNRRSLARYHAAAEDELRARLARPRRARPASPDSYEDLLAGVLLAFRPAGWRAGQTVFNALHARRPDLADVVRGTDVDPFHRDDRLPALLAWLRAHWDDPPPRPTLDDLLREARAEEVGAAATADPDRDPVTAAGEERARVDLLRRHEELRSRLDELLADARGAGWTPAAWLVDGLYDRLAELRAQLEEGP